VKLTKPQTKSQANISVDYNVLKIGAQKPNIAAFRLWLFLRGGDYFPTFFSENSGLIDPDMVVLIAKLNNFRIPRKDRLVKILYSSPTFFIQCPDGRFRVKSPSKIAKLSGRKCQLSPELFKVFTPKKEFSDASISLMAASKGLVSAHRLAGGTGFSKSKIRKSIRQSAKAGLIKRAATYIYQNLSFRDLKKARWVQRNFINIENKFMRIFYSEGCYHLLQQGCNYYSLGGCQIDAERQPRLSRGELKFSKQLSTYFDALVFEYKFQKIPPSYAVFN